MRIPHGTHLLAAIFRLIAINLDVLSSSSCGCATGRLAMVESWSIDRTKKGG